ncbi:hypothetical protein RDABS01_026520 [Bienertia sinuspersici]
MAFYEEDEVWKCTQHPSKRRRTGVCPLCLKQRLSQLCPECANVRPCACCATTSSSSSASSSFSLQITDVNRISNLIDVEPAFRRSKSSAFPFLRFSESNNITGKTSENLAGNSSSFWSLIWPQNKPRRENTVAVMRRSSSVSVAESEVKSSSKSKGWYFPSPMKVFRHSHSKTHKVAHERSPLHRG